MKDIELLPCPFCGNDAETVDDLVTLHVECRHCGATGGVSSHKRGAVESWNRRAVVDANTQHALIDTEALAELMALAERIEEARWRSICVAPECALLIRAMLSASPAPAQQERKPMTDEERHALFAGLLSETVDKPTEMFRLIVERVERHHEIKE